MNDTPQIAHKGYMGRPLLIQSQKDTIVSIWDTGRLIHN